MKSARFLSLAVLILIFAFSTFSYAGVPQLMNYQGKLTTPAGALIDSTLSMSFSIYDNQPDVSPVWAETLMVQVEKGIFSVVLGNVHPIPNNLFDGTVQYLGVKAGTDPEMTPRKEIVSVGYAQRAAYAEVAVSDGDWYFRVTDTADTTLITGSKWGIARSGAILYGSADSTHVNFGLTCTTGTSGEDYKYCTVGGGLYNSAGHNLTTVGGGLWNKATETTATIAGGYRNVAGGDYATVGGGNENTADFYYSTIAGGIDNTVSGYASTIGGGSSNTITFEGAKSTIAGGENNSATNQYVTIGGGRNNHASWHRATIGGGEYNRASGYAATIPGGAADTVLGDYSFATGEKVKVIGDYTFAFGRDFTTSTPNAVIFHNSVDPIKVGIGTTNPFGKLHVSNSDDPLMYLGNTGEVDSQTVTLSFKQGAYTNTRIRAVSDDPFNEGKSRLEFMTDETVRATILSNGNVGIGTTSPQGALDVSSTTGAFIVPRMTTAQRDALSAVNGMIIYNTTTNQFNFYENGAWVTK
jgi:hypothetical protein